jgi:hypothetical protein
MLHEVEEESFDVSQRDSTSKHSSRPPEAPADTPVVVVAANASLTKHRSAASWPGVVSAAALEDAAGEFALAVSAVFLLFERVAILAKEK